MAKAYIPKITDPRVKKRIQDSLDWVHSYLSVNNPRSMANREIQRHFGVQTRPLARWLKAKLLHRTSAYYSNLTGQCQSYIINLDGYTEVCQLIGHSPKFQPTQKIQQEVDTGEFDYIEKSDRSFNQLQYVKRDIRNAYLHNNGYLYHYDIEAAAPTLLYQRAEKLARQAQKPFELAYMKQYIFDRAGVRVRIAKHTQASVEQVKRLINALLQGGRLSSFHNNQTFAEINYDWDLLKRLQNSVDLKNLLGDFKKLWQILRDEIPVRYLTDKNGLVRRRALSGRDKSGYYRQLEKDIGDVIRRYLKRNSVRHLWIHDGWSCDRIIDDIELCSEVRRLTGYTVKLDREVFDNDSSY